MASFDYTALKATAATLIAEFGRSATFTQFGAPADVNKPWDNTTARSAPLKEVALNVVSVEPSSREELGTSQEVFDILKRSKRILIVDVSTEDIFVFGEVLDDGQRWKIDHIEELKPASLAMLAYVGISR